MNYLCDKNVFFSEYFLEDCVQMLNFMAPPPESKKRKGGGDKDDGIPDEFEENLNTKVSSEYSEQTRKSVAMISEKDISVELVEVGVCW